MCVISLRNKFRRKTPTAVLQVVNKSLEINDKKLAYFDVQKMSFNLH